MRAVNQPESWWGWHGWDQPQPLSIVQIMQSGTLPPRLAAALWLGLERGASIILAAEPPGAGKTTIMTALLALAPPEMVAYFTRGWGETFELPPPNDAYPTYIMVNEMSDHLPVYSWGPYVVRTFELLNDGYSLCTTLHAETVDEVLEQLELDNGVPRTHLANLTFVVPLVIGHRDGQSLRRVRDVGVIEADAVERIATWDEKSDAFSVLDTPEQRTLLAKRLRMDAAWFESELAVREAFLQKLLSDGVSEIDAVQDAVEAFRDGVR
jgi:type IV secretory pathway ATPase VirB11/archaellum biosynthesis ATPase